MDVVVFEEKEIVVEEEDPKDVVEEEDPTDVVDEDDPKTIAVAGMEEIMPKIWDFWRFYVGRDAYNGWLEDGMSLADWEFINDNILHLPFIPKTEEERDALILWVNAVELELHLMKFQQFEQ